MEVVKTGHELIDELIENTQGSSTWWYDCYNLFPDFKILNNRIYFTGIRGCYEKVQFHATLTDGALTFSKGDLSLLENAYKLYTSRRTPKKGKDFAWTMTYESPGRVDMSKINDILDQLDVWARSGDFPAGQEPKYMVGDYGPSLTIKLISVTCPKFTISLSGLSSGYLSFQLNPTTELPKPAEYIFTATPKYGTVSVPGSPFLDWASCLVTEPSPTGGRSKSRHPTDKDVSFVVDTIFGKAGS